MHGLRYPLCFSAGLLALIYFATIVLGGHQWWLGVIGGVLGMAGLFFEVLEDDARPSTDVSHTS